MPKDQTEPRAKPAVDRSAVQWSGKSTADVLNLDRDRFDEWAEDDPMFRPRPNRESAIITDEEKQRLWDVFGLLKRVVAQSTDGSVSTADIRNLNSEVRDLFRYELQAVPALVAAAPALPSGGLGSFTVRLMSWQVLGEEGSYVGSEVIATLVEALQMIAGQGRALLKCCPAPLHPTAEHGLGTCNTFFVDLHTGRPRSTCSDVCRRRLSDWRRRHAKPEEAFPPRSFPK